MKNKIFKHLENVKYGHLIITTPDDEKIAIGDKNSDLQADIKINNWSLLDLVLSKGDIGFGEGYIKGVFTSSKIEKLLLFASLNQDELSGLFHSNILYSIFFGVKNLLKKNSLKGSKKNIEYHYDLGNDFYSLWLDETMSYSSGIFAGDETLTKTQHNKYQRILDQIERDDSEILEIGCGWGGFIDAASKRGHKIKGLTLSKEQKAYSDQFIKNNNLNSHIALQDYRLETGKFDNIVSIEMFEAVGKKYWNNYFSKIKECLKKDGKAIIQTITMSDDFYKKYQKSSDYIREYIFPGGFLPSPNIFRKLAQKHDLKIVDEFEFGDSYAKTLLKWLENFNNVQNEVRKLGYDQEFIRKWQFYLAYCIGSFTSKRTDVIQFSLTHA
jgi:cyclopropane-fatty-acyl-phospholipid synthase